MSKGNVIELAGLSACGHAQAGGWGMAGRWWYATAICRSGSYRRVLGR